MIYLIAFVILIYGLGFLSDVWVAKLKAEKEQFDIKINEELYTLVQLYGGAKITWISKDIVYELPGAENSKKKSLTQAEVDRISAYDNPIDILNCLMDIFKIHLSAQSQMSLAEWKYIIEDISQGKNTDV